MSPILTADDLHRIFKNLGTNNNGLVEFTRRRSKPKSKKKPMVHSVDQASDDLLKAFEVFDLNGDGHITCEELEAVLSRWELWGKSNGQNCKDMIRVFDENSDGVLDFEEFKVMMSIPCKPHNSEDD